MFRRAVRFHQSAARIRIRGPILLPDQVQHDLSLIIELKTEPVPTYLIFPQLVAAELVIHPTQPADFFCSAVNRNLTLGLHSSQRVIVRSSPFAFPLLTETVVTVQHRGLSRTETKAQPSSSVVHLDQVSFQISLHFPILVPN